MTYDWKKAKHLTKGDYIYTPDYITTSSTSFSPYAVWKVKATRSYNVEIAQLFTGLILVLDPKEYVRNIGPRPPWALESK